MGHAEDGRNTPPTSHRVGWFLYMGGLVLLAFTGINGSLLSILGLIAIAIGFILNRKVLFYMLGIRR